MKAADATVRLIWEDVLDIDRMRRYYGYLANRLGVVNDLLVMVSMAAALGGLAALLARFPEWVPATVAAGSAASSTLLAVGRFQQEASLCSEIYMQVGRIAGDWQDLWSEIDVADDESLRAAWNDLSRRQGVAVERAPSEVPYWRWLARRCEREADQYWTARYASA